MSNKCTLVNASALDDLNFIWPYVRQYILDASEQAKETDELHILGDIIGGKKVLFVVTTEDDYIGAMTIEIQHHPLRTIAQIVHLGSKNFKLMKTTFPALITWAREQGAEAIREHGRPGWERLLVPLGFEPKYYVMEKQI